MEFNNTSKVLVVGDAMLDHYIVGSTTRISPESPVPVVNVKNEEYRLGGAANVAAGLAQLGIPTTLLSVVGQDSMSEILNSSLVGKGIHPVLIKLSSAQTIVKSRLLANSQQVVRIDYESEASCYHSPDLLQKYSEIIGDYDLVVFSDYGKGGLSDIQEMIKLCRSFSINSVVDPKGTNFAKYKGASYITPNMNEFTQVVGKLESELDIELKGKQLVVDLELSNLILTRSEDGISLISESSVRHYKATAKEVYDVTGAGDTVVTFLSAALMSEKTIDEAVFIANIAGGVAVSKKGTSVVSMDDFRRAYHNSELLMEEKIVPTGYFSQFCRDIKFSGKKIVVTNGCFDLLHPGHIAYLNEAKELGDILIVLVNDDHSIKRLKGAGRPVNSIDSRLMMLAALSSVSYVVSFNEDTPLNPIKMIAPDVLVKGGDYKISEIVGAEFVIECGGEVKVIDFLPGYSSTALIKKIRENND